MADPTLHLAEFAAQLRFEDLPPDVVVMAKRLVLDTLGTSIAATTLGSGCREAVAAITALGGTPESTIVGHPVKVPAPSAAFANGALAHALNYDAIGPEVGHVGVPCLAAPLAAAEAAHASGRVFLTAVVVAAECTARITSAMASHENFRNKRFLRGQFLSYLPAAAGAGNAFALDAKQMHSALGAALMQAAGTSQVVIGGDPPAKSIYGAFPNQAGVLAALLSRAGLQADYDVLEGEAGLYGMLAQGHADLRVLEDGLGNEFLVRKTEFKTWPVSAHVSPYIEGALELLDAGLQAKEIEAIEIAGPTDVRAWCEPLAERRRPANPAAAANSIVFAVAKALARGAVTLADFTADGLRDTASRELADRTTCRTDDDITTAAMRIRTKDGGEVTVARPSGGSRSHVAPERLEAKFRDCCSYSAAPLSQIEVASLIETVAHLETLPDVRVLGQMIGGKA